MKQVLQNLKDGRTELAEVPCPGPRAGHLLIRTHASLVSAGTERMLLEFGKAGWIDKARQQPDKVKQVLEKVRTDGLAPTLEAVRSKLDQPIALGYCNVGEVIGSGKENPGGPFEPGARVVSNGAHAETVSVPRNLCARVPEGVSDEEAAFTVVGAIALQGVRLAQPTLGECFVVTGLGLIGLMAVQLLKAHGCRVLGIDLDPRKLELARSFGAETVDLSRGEDPILNSEGFSRGRGVDGVLITASTKSSEPVHQAALMCRKRGRIVLVGVTGLELSRDDFYKKELSFQVSCSYGPGRYDPQYEEKGCDYPVGHVRWTAQRNFEAVLDMMAAGTIDVRPLISHRFSLDEAEQAYAVLGGEEPHLGILLRYAGGECCGGMTRTVELTADERRFRQIKEKAPQLTQSCAKHDDNAKEIGVYRRSSAVGPVVGFIGAGNYAGRVLIPAFKGAGAVLHSVASGGGVSAVHYGKKFGFQQATTEVETLLAHQEIDTLVIATRHDTHAQLVCEALKAGKHVFVEKPLCITLDELAAIQDTVASLPASSAPPKIMLGFNRRFAPQVRKMKELLAGVPGPKSFIMTVNAGQVPADHWTQDPAVGGGRIIGEACHFIDLLRFLAGTAITRHDATSVGEDRRRDTATLTLGFADGSLGVVHYLANGHKSFPKERLEVFCGGRVLQLDNFRKLRGFGWKGFKKLHLWRQDKGQAACAAAFVAAVREGKPSPIAFEELVEVSRVTIQLASAD